MPVTTLEATGLGDLLARVLEIGRTLPRDAFLWYRGLDCPSYGLVPKIMRDGKDERQVFDRERRLLTRFRQRSLAYWAAGYPQNDWEHLFAMQHYGMPTRLLDWSENLFVAAHFALAKQPNHQHTGPCVPVIWCVNPVEWNRSTPLLSEYGQAIQVLTTADEELDSYRPETNKRRLRSPLAIFGTHNSNRIVAQRGTFMIWGNEVKTLQAFSEEQSATLWQINLMGDRDELARSLRLLGFSETMVFPELPSLASELSMVEGWRDA